MTSGGLCDALTHHRLWRGVLRRLLGGLPLCDRLRRRLHGAAHHRPRGSGIHRRSASDHAVGGVRRGLGDGARVNVPDQPLRPVRAAPGVPGVAGKPYSDLEFHESLLYRVVRHPLLLGFIVAFWAAPTMTAGHLLFAVATTAYMLIAIQLEE